MLLSSADPLLEFTTDQCHTLSLDCPITFYELKDNRPKDNRPKDNRPQDIANLEGIAFTVNAHHLTLIKKTDRQTPNRQKPASKSKKAASLAPMPRSGPTTASADPAAMAVDWAMPADPATTSAERATPLQDCHLMLSVSLEQYQHILEHGLFHLKPEVRGPLHQVDFLPDLPILLELGLQPYIFRPDNHPVDPPESHRSPPSEAPITIAEHKRAIALLSDLLTRIENKDPTEKTDDIVPIPDPKPLDPKTSGFIQDLLGPSKCTPYASWQTTDGWLCRSVQQRQNDETVGYATLWAYATPEQTEPVVQSGQTALDAIATLLQNTSDAVQSELEQHLPQVKQSLSVFSDELITALEQVDWETLLASDAPPQTEPLDNEEEEWRDRPLSDVVKQFFDDDEWPYVVLLEDTEIQNPKSKIQNPPTPNPSQEGDRTLQNPKSKIQNPPTPNPSQEGDRTLQNPKSKIQNPPTPNPSQEGDRTLQNPKSKIQNPPTPNPSQEGDRTLQNPKSKIQNPQILQLAFQGDSGRWTCLAQADDEAQQVVFYSLCPVSVADEHYGAIAELILRVNDRLIIGNFELDIDQGDIRYKTSLDTEGDRLTPALMRRLVYANVHTMDTYLPGIIAVLAGDCSPVAAIAAVEQTTSEF